RNGCRPAMHSAQEAVEIYIRAKDENRPYLMERAFAENAKLEMVVRSGTIAFPPVSIGLQTISDVLVRRFAQTYENVQTFCLSTPPPDDQPSFSCYWLVGMSEKDSRSVRVGCGRYDWQFQSQGQWLVDRLAITIERMESLPPSYLASVMNWLSRLPYPWCAARIALAGIPSFDLLYPIREDLERACA
ncbi:MAG: hypothetical protein ABI939_09725, partial [Anaerolineaceae bacterium]